VADYGHKLVVLRSFLNFEDVELESANFGQLSNRFTVETQDFLYGILANGFKKHKGFVG